MGRETLGTALKKIMKKPGFEGHFTNHSLRRSSPKRLYQSGVPEQVIVETPGHRSFNGLGEYKFTSSTLKREASEILLGRYPRKVKQDVEEKRKSCLRIMLNTLKKKKWD